MIDMDKIIEIIRTEADEEYKDAEINADTDLQEDLDFNSLNMLVVVNEIEEEYSITIEIDDLKSIRTIGDIEKLVLNFSPEK